MPPAQCEYVVGCSRLGVRHDVHQVLKQSVLYRMYQWSAPATAGYAMYYPLAGWVSAWISLKAILMCLTGRVSWRGTTYGPGTPASPARPEPADPARA